MEIAKIEKFRDCDLVTTTDGDYFKVPKEKERPCGIIEYIETKLLK